MRINRIYQNDNLNSGALIQLDDKTSKYVTRVLRLKSGARLQIFNGVGDEFSATITAIDKHACFVKLNEKLDNNSESTLSIHLVQAIVRGEKMDWVIQKSVELGVREITTVFTQYSEVKLTPERQEKRLAHWRSVAISACEQCGRAVLPVINMPLPLSDFFAQHEESTNESLRLIFHPLAAKSLKQFTDPVKQITLLIGPEGGFSNDEVSMAANYGFQAVKFGPRILRTETAGLAGITALQYQWGDMG